MSLVDLILGLPVELSGEIVGRWLRVEEIVRLESAFCQAVARESLHHNVFTSSSCIITSVCNVRESDLMLLQMLNWVAARRIRAEHVDVRGKNDLISEEYLQLHGKHIKSIQMRGICAMIDVHNILIARYCANLRSVDYCASIFSDSFLQLLNACPRIESLKIYTYYTHPPRLNVEPRTSLRVHSLDMDCEEAEGERILSMCAPEAVQRLKISHEVRIFEWSRFNSLRSLGLSECTITRHSLTLILDQCPSLVNLRLSPNSSFDRALGEHIPPLRSLNIEDGNMDSELQLFCPEFVQKQKHTLAALFTRGCRVLTRGVVNLVLAECPLLHTLSFDCSQTVDFSLMGSLTTLIMDVVVGDDDWGVIQQHCRSLQCLHVIFKYVYVSDLTPMITAVNEMSSLRALYFVGVRWEQHTACIEAAAKLRVLRPSLYIEEEEEEWAWYDLFKLPI